MDLHAISMLVMHRRLDNLLSFFFPLPQRGECASCVPHKSFASEIQRSSTSLHKSQRTSSMVDPRVLGPVLLLSCTTKYLDVLFISLIFCFYCCQLHTKKNITAQHRRIYITTQKHKNIVYIIYYM